MSECNHRINMDSELQRMGEAVMAYSEVSIQCHLEQQRRIKSTSQLVMIRSRFKPSTF